ncbi:MAG TPA: cupin domain-containing protein [Reyranella sp.]|nr:cupin domain-containing protein [Reyranella sp.]
MTAFAAGRPTPFLLNALLALTVALTAALAIARPLVPASRLGDLLDATICWASAATSDRPATRPTVVGSEPLASDAGKRITSMIVDFPPNAFSPEHHHEADLYVYVLQGTIHSQLGGQPAMTYTAGQSFFEPEGSVHVFAENASPTEPARILAVFVHREGARLIVFH